MLRLHNNCKQTMFLAQAGTMLTMIAVSIPS